MEFSFELCVRSGKAFSYTVGFEVFEILSRLKVQMVYLLI